MSGAMPGNETNARPMGHLGRLDKIAVLRANLLGDLIVSLPAFEALRAAYPDAEIVLLARDWHRTLLGKRSSPIHRVVVIPELPGLCDERADPADESEIEDFFERMVREGFDLALQMHGGGRYSNSVVRRLGAGLTAGLRTPDALPLDCFVPYDRNQHEVLRYLEVVSLVGAPPVHLSPRLAVTQADRDEVDALLPPAAQPIVALHPGARHPERRWPPDRFAAVGDAMASAGARVVVTGHPEESAITRSVLDAMAYPALDLSGRLTIGGLAGLYSRCSLVISNDTGPLHLAGAVGAPTVGIFWGYNFVAYGPLTRTRHRVAVSWRDERQLCRPGCDDPYCEQCEPFVADIPVDAVRSHALDLLLTSQPPAEAGRPVAGVAADVTGVIDE